MQSVLVLAQQQGNPASSLWLLVVMGLIFYLLIIRPQRTRAQRHKALVSSVGLGDRVVTIGGIYGTVRSLDEETFDLEVSPGTVLTMARAAISRTLADPDSTDVDTGPDSGTSPI